MAKHQPPSQIKYNREHPPVTFRLTKSMRTVLDAVKGNRKYSEAAKDIMSDKLMPALEIKTKMEAEQAEKCDKCGKCPICGREKRVLPNAKRACLVCQGKPT